MSAYKSVFNSFLLRSPTFFQNSNPHKLQNISKKKMILLVFWVKFWDWLKSWWGILIPKPVWPHCPYCKVMGFWSPKMGCPLVTRKSVCRGSKLILSLMGRPLRQSVPDQLEGNKMLMLSKAAFPRVLKYNWLEVALNNSWKKSKIHELREQRWFYKRQANKVEQRSVF